MKYIEHKANMLRHDRFTRMDKRYECAVCINTFNDTVIYIWTQSALYQTWIKRSALRVWNPLIANDPSMDDRVLADCPVCETPITTKDVREHGTHLLDGDLPVCVECYHKQLLKAMEVY